MALPGRSGTGKRKLRQDANMGEVEWFRGARRSRYRARLADEGRAGRPRERADPGPRIYIGSIWTKEERQSNRFVEEGRRRGSIEAMKQLAELYGEGVFVATDDQASISWYDKAIEAGDKSSIDILFSIYADQNSAFFDPKLAAEYMMKLMISELREVNWAQKLSNSLDSRTISAVQQLLANSGFFHDEIDA